MDSVADLLVDYIGELKH